MNVLIIGTGNMGRGISTRLLSGGHDVTLYNPDRADAEKLAAELPTSRGRVSTTGELAQAVRGSDVVILASWYGVNLQTARELASDFAGKVVVDISNPLTETMELETEGGPSGAEHIQAAAPDAKVVKAFNTTFAGTLIEGRVAGQTLDVFMAGDDEGAKSTVATLVRDGGLNAIDAGGLVRARQLEGLGLLGITLQFRLNTGFGTAWKLVLPGGDQA